jgi:hypothetical protein
MEVETPTVPFDPVEALKRRCTHCKRECGGKEANLSWETMDFCNEECLGEYLFVNILTIVFIVASSPPPIYT